MTDAPAPPPDGKIDELMSKLLGRSWRTTLIGLLVIGGGCLPLVPGIPPEVLHKIQIAIGIATGGGFVVSKDAKVTGAPK